MAQMAALPNPPVYQDWNSFLASFNWRRGEHITVIGPTGSGKSTLAFELARKRRFVILFITSAEDDTADRAIKRGGYEIERSWPISPFAEKVALWPEFHSVDSFAQQAAVFRSAIDGRGKVPGIFREGEWTVVLDEVWYLTDRLHLDDELAMLWTQGRKKGISVLAGSQRPFLVPQYMLNQANHLFLFQVADKREIQRLSEIGGNISEIIKDVVPHLQKHEFLYVNARTGDYRLSRVAR